MTISRRRFLGLSAAAASMALTGRGLAQGATSGSGRKPSASAIPSLRIGAILPTMTGTQAIGAFSNDVVGSVANLGVTMAMEALADEVEEAGSKLKVLVTSAPDAATSARAADRLIGVEEVRGIVGAFDVDTAAMLAAKASRAGVLFMNIGAQADDLRGANCDPFTFHVEASSSMYVDAMVRRYIASGVKRWCFVRTDESEQVARFERAKQTLRALDPGATSVTDVRVEEGQPDFTGSFEAVADGAPDLVAMLLSPLSQLVFLGQFQTSDLDAKVIGYPAPATQLRQFYATSAYDAPTAGSGQHEALWDASLDQGGAADVNARFLNRFGRGMDPPAWAAYVAVKVMTDAATHTGSLEPSDWAEYLADPSTTVDVYKGLGTSFRPWDHQLRQPLYILDTNMGYTDAKYYRDIATLDATVPDLQGAGVAEAEGRLDLLGVGESATACVLK